ncbi:hypothetical protein [Moraxella catarrhalis]|uniref:terminase small subunit-like protein n=1 Tax=Moraxella catarrhalis TaxID=480 RepID=UPI0007E4795E|nr:hypothetical protein [Moraxella catarrhalis]OAV06004.1 Phage terminase, small subunit [Moraxella catarrhalis]DAX96583.1 MAG TPA: Sf6 terminase small subunit gp1, octamer, DNA-binding, CAPS buffer.65A [Caudoviricetes sp.]
MANKKPKMGRPSIFTDELANEICERVSLGRSLRSVCLDKDMPTKTTVMRWLDENEDFCDQYRRACEDRETTHFEEMLTIADEVLPETAEVARAKLRIDTRKWVLARMNPKKYSDKVQEDNADNAVSLMAQFMKELGEKQGG